MKKIFCVGYMKWALPIYKSVQGELDNVLIISGGSDEESHSSLLKIFKLDYFLFYERSDLFPLL